MMQEIGKNNTSIAKNTILLYIRMLIIMVVNLYASRLVLKQLGVEDFGVYNVVAGFVTMFSLISNALSTGITRYVTYEIGTGNQNRLNQIFACSVSVQILLGFIIFVLIEIVGVWFLNNKMLIDESRIAAANWVLQLSAITFWINLISVPYNADIIAHEHMDVYAYITIAESLLKLLACFLLYVIPFDLLIAYSVLLTIIAIIIRFSYGIYCKKHFEECSAKLKIDKEIIKNLASFSGWNMIGASSAILRDYGVNVLLNLFFGPIVNAARGIAMQVSVAVQSFSSSFILAINPQITKNYASNNWEKSFHLVFWGAKLAYFLLFIIALPFLFETKFILNLWLGEYPEITIVFVRLIILYVLSESISYTMVTLMLSTGNIKWYQIIVGGCQMLNFPISYILLHMGFGASSTFFVAIVIAICCLILRLYMLNRMIKFPIKSFCKDVILSLTKVTIPSIFLCMCISLSIEKNIVYSILNMLICVLLGGISVFYLGFSSLERNQVLSLIKKKMNL